MDNTERDYYIKEVEDNNYKKYNVFVVHKNIPLDEKMIKEMEKYDCKVVEFEVQFNQSLCDNLPSRIEKIVFKEKFNKFNQPVDNLPKELKKITFGYHFNKPVDNLPTDYKDLLLVLILISQLIIYLQIYKDLFLVINLTSQ